MTTLYHWLLAFRALPVEAQLLLGLVALMHLDIATGVLAAYRARTLSSKLSWRGLTRKALTLSAVATAATVQLLLPHLPVPGEALVVPVILWFIGSELLSIVENLARGGVLNPALFGLAETLKR